jgi:hypothetical protein
MWDNITCDAHVGTFMETSKTLAPQAMEADFRGSDEGDLLSSKLVNAWTSWLFSISSFLIWFSKSWDNTPPPQPKRRDQKLSDACKKKVASKQAQNQPLQRNFILAWSLKQVCALPDTKSDMWAELQVDKSHRIVTTPRENVPAWRGGGGALQIMVRFVS